MTAGIRRSVSPFRLGILVAVLMCAIGGTSLGWWPFGGWGQLGWAPGVPLQSSNLERLPHFSLFPPVYYSHPVRHPYGYSPFARFPELTSIWEVRSAGPLTVRNPFLSKLIPHLQEDAPASGPLVVKNPFFERKDKTGLDKPGEIATLTAPSK